MNEETRTRYQLRAEILKSLAHPTRLFIVEELARGRRCVQDLTAMVGADTSTVSRHLSILRQAGLTECDKEGSRVYYRLKAPCVLQFFSCLESVISANP